jgi:ferrous iron transport protein A
MEGIRMPLSIVQEGRFVRFVAVDAGHGLQCRLAAMGLVPGTEIEVIRNHRRGPFMIAVRGCRIMLGQGIAGKIVVE